MTRSSPGINLNAKGRPPAVNATTILLTVLVESAIRMGETASAGPILPDATSEAIETAAECVGSQLPVGKDRQGYQRGCCKDQTVSYFALIEDGPDEMMQLPSCSQYPSQCHSHGCGQHRLAYRKSAKQDGQNESNLSGDSRIGAAGPEIRHGSQSDRASRCDREQELATDLIADGTCQRHNCESAYSRRRPRRSFALSTLAFSADQESNPEGYCKFHEYGIKDRH
jgi:hypothetical protein